MRGTATAKTAKAKPAAKPRTMRTRKGKKVYPLTAAQRLHFYSSLYCPRKELLNIGTSLTIEVELDFDALERAIHEAYSRCESMRLRFAQDKNGACYQYVVDSDGRDVERFDFTGWTKQDADAKLREWTATPFEMYDSPMNRVVMIIMPDGSQGIYLLVHHMCMDAQSLILFFRDIIEIYCSGIYEDAPYPAPMYSYLEQLEKDLAYEAGSEAQKRDREFFEKLISSSEPFFADIEGPARLESERGRKNKPKLRAADTRTGNVEANIKSFHLEAEPTARLMSFCEKYRTSPVCLLMLAVRTYLQKQNGEDDVSIVTNVARRAKLSEKRSGGTRIHCFPLRTIIPEDKTFLEALAIIRDGQNAIFRHADYDPVEYFSTRSRVYGLEDETYEPISLTYQPLTRSDQGLGLEKLDGINYSTAWYSNGVAAQALYLTVTHRQADNGLDFNWEYQTGAATPEQLERVYYYICRILFEAERDPQQTIGEIIAAV